MAAFYKISPFARPERGAGTGFGRATALAFTREGAVVGLTKAAATAFFAGTVLHLCSDEASFTNRALFIVDGGQTAH